MFLQIAVPNDDSLCLQFLWREDSEQKIEVCEYTRHVFGAISSPTCANYALHQVAKDNAVNDESPSEPLDKQSKSTRKSETSSSKVDSILRNG